MIVERSMSLQFLSNAYLVCDGLGGPAFFVDAGGPVGPLLDAAGRLGVQPTAVLLTHHHFDHVSELDELRQQWPGLRVMAHPREREMLSGDDASGDDASGDEASGASRVSAGGSGSNRSGRIEALEPGSSLRFGALEVCPLHTPGHTAGMLSFIVFEPSKQPRRPAGATGGPGGFPGGDAIVFTGDTLFKGSVGGVRAPGHTTYNDLRDSIMGNLMELPPQTIVYPGHTEDTTVAQEWERNPFVRLWRGLDAEGDRRCTALGEPATLILLAADYDGGKKAWVRWADGRDDIVPGSRVELPESA